MLDVSDLASILSTFELKKHALGMFYKSLKTEIIHKSFDGRVVIFHVKKQKPQ